ncbi:MAG: carbohydrate ABC transporter permease [Staphylothermus sp.]|nr:carbohydrate ABC transporter permease [Staphylothermus sp.]
MSKKYIDIKKIKKRILLEKIAKALIVLFVAVIPSIPIWLMYLGLIAQAFSSKVTLGIIPNGFTLKNWRFLWSTIQMGLKKYPNIWPITINSLYLALGTALLVTFVAGLAGYALSRMEFRGRTKMMEFILALHAFPSIVLLIALFVLLNKLGLYGRGFITLTGVMITKAALEAPMGAWIMKGFFDNVPWDIEWAALVDGCNRLTAWRKVILPLVLPGFAAVAVFAFLAGWAEFIMAFTFIREDRWWPLSVMIYHVIGEYKFVDWGFLAALSLFYALPTIIFFVFSQKLLLRIYVGGVKG